MPRREGEDRFQVADFNNNYSDKNFLIVDQSVNPEKAEKYFDTRFTVPVRPFDNNKLEMCKQSLNFQKPSQRLSELKEVKENQKLYAQWREVYNEKNKSYRYHK